MRLYLMFQMNSIINTAPLSGTMKHEHLEREQKKISLSEPLYNLEDTYKLTSTEWAHARHRQTQSAHRVCF